MLKATQNPVRSIPLLTQACFGVFIGALFSLILAYGLFAVGGKGINIPDEILPWNTNNVLYKPREKGFYLLTLILGFAMGRLLVNKAWCIPYQLVAIMLLLSMPIFNFFAKSILQLDSVFTFVILLLTFSSISFVAYSLHRSGFSYETATQSDCDQKDSYGFLYFISLLLITFILTPSSFLTVASRIDLPWHLVSFMIGPSLYFGKANLVPGLDYFTQYSLGMGWFFHFLSGKSTADAILNYVYLVIAATWIFYAQLLFLLRWLYRSWFVATLVTLSSLVLLFHTKSHFFDPSSTVLRYPLLICVAFALKRWLKNPSGVFVSLLMAFLLALSVFINTETGIISGLAFVLSGFVVSSGKKKILASIITVSCVSFLVFVALLVAVFGVKVVSLDFISHLIKPLLIYGKVGFGGWPIHWSMADFNWFYNLLLPAITLATLALIARMRKDDVFDRERLSVLAFFSLVALLMMAKYINMSIVAVWQMNALGMFVILGWWLNIVLNSVSGNSIKFPLSLRVSVSTCCYSAFLVGFVALTALSSDSRNPSQYGFQSWVRYPSLVKSFFKRGDQCHEISCVPYQPTENDIALIKKRTKSTDRVAIVDLYDWAYLIEAKRLPLMHFLPSIDIFTSNQLKMTTQNLMHSEFLFLPKGVNGEPVIGGPLKDVLLPTFHENYIYDGEGDKLVAWKRIKYHKANV